MRSLGRASMKRWVISLMASTRLARSPPMEKSSVSMERDTSSAIMMSMPLASTCVNELLNCGRASARRPGGKRQRQQRARERARPRRARLAQMREGRGRRIHDRRRAARAGRAAARAAAAAPAGRATDARS